MTRTYYDVLEVAEDATQAEITAAYREKVKEYHPDVSDADDADERFKRVKEAEEVLGDEDERARYDRLGHEAYVEGGPHDAGETADGAADGPWAEDGFDGFDFDGYASDTSADGGFSPGGGSGGASASASAGFGSAAQRQESGPGPGGNRWASESYSAGGTGEESSEGYSVRDWDDPDAGPDTVTVEMTQELVVVAGSMFVLYPILVYSSVTASFPLVANVAVAACTLLAVGYLLTIPRVAVPVFGVWSLLAPVGAVLLGFDLMAGLFAVGVCWVPFGYSLIVGLVARPG